MPPKRTKKRQQQYLIQDDNDNSSSDNAFYESPGIASSSETHWHRGGVNGGVPPPDPLRGGVPPPDPLRGSAPDPLLGTISDDDSDVTEAAAATVPIRRQSHQLDFSASGEWTRPVRPQSAPIATATIASTARATTTALEHSRGSGGRSPPPSGVRLEDVAPFPKSGASVPTWPGREARFRPENAGWLQRTYLPPYAAPATDMTTVRSMITWRRREIADMKRLHEQPWYQFAELVAGLAGMAMSKVVYISEQPRDHEDPGIGAAALLQEQAEQQQGIERLNDFAVDRNAYRDQELDLARALGNATATVLRPGQGQTLNGRIEAVRMARWLTGPLVSGTVFFTPLYTSNREAALARVRTIMPDATADALERGNGDVRVWFATIVASLMNVSQFVAGRTPLRAGDYDKYIDRIDEAMLRLRGLTAARTTMPSWTPYDTPATKQRLALAGVRRLTLGMPGYTGNL